MLLVALAAALPLALEPAETPAPDELMEIIVEAPEPRYVAPTLRDRIGRIWAPVFINGKGPFRLVLDTGSNRSAVMAPVAQQLGIAITPEHQVLLRGVTGAQMVPTISVDTIVVGELELHSKRLPILTDALGGAEGVLGNEGLQDKRIVIDFRHDLIKIIRSHAERARPGFVTVPVRMQRGLLLIADVIVGPVKAKAIIDTGGQVTIANAAFREAMLKRVRPEDVNADEITGVTLDVQRGDRVLTPPIRIGELVIRRAHITVGDLAIFQHWKMTRDPA
ncbi:MAG: retropepsin-like aspartic protease, partial [Steroidobacterales bacterium]